MKNNGTGRGNRKHPFKPATPLELEMGRELKKSPFMIRYYGYRMGLEFYLKRMLTPKESGKLASSILKEMRIRKWSRLT